MSTREQAATLAAWAGVWSPVVPASTRAACWAALDLPETFTAIEPLYWSVFHAAAPVPRVPLLLHSALDRPGAAVREEWLRLIGFLDLRWRHHTLPPDHLAAACEVLAAAVENADAMLSRELCRRYLLPWCAVAAERLREDNSPLLRIVDCFAEDVARASGAPDTTPMHGHVRAPGDVP